MKLLIKSSRGPDVFEHTSNRTIKWVLIYAIQTSFLAVNGLRQAKPLVQGFAHVLAIIKNKVSNYTHTHTCSRLAFIPVDC